MGSILPPIPEDLFLEHIVKVILEGTFDEVTARLGALRLVNTAWSQMIRNHPEWLARYQAMRANQQYIARAADFGLRVVGESSLEPNPNHDKEMQALEDYFNPVPKGGDATRDGDTHV
jgi:hypothetical protein